MFKSTKSLVCSTPLVGALLVLSSMGVADFQDSERKDISLENLDSSTVGYSTSSHAISSTPAHSVKSTSSEVHTPTPTPTPAPKPSPECQNYPEDSRKFDICDSYTSNVTHVVDTLPAASHLAKNALYIVNQADVVVRAPYVVPEGTAILPSPALSVNNVTPLNITAETGSGSSDKCDSCILVLSEKSRVAGISIKANASGWNVAGSSSSGKVSSLVYGETTDSELSESLLIGGDMYDSLIQQKVTPDQNPDTAQRYFNLFLILNGADNGLLLENASDKPVEQPEDATFTPWDAYVSGAVEMTGRPSTSANTQRALAFVNIRPQIGASSLVFGAELPEGADFERHALYLKDTVRSSLFLNRPVSRLKKERYQDLQVFIEGEQAKEIHVYAGGNSYSWLAREIVASLGKASGTLYKGPEVATMDLQPMDLTDPQHILSYSRKMGVYQGSVIEIEAMFKKYSDKASYNLTHPLIQTRDISSTTNFTVINVTDPQTYMSSCSANMPWYGHWETWVTACGMTAAGMGVTLLTGLLVVYKCWPRNKLNTAGSNSPLLPANDS